MLYHPQNLQMITSITVYAQFVHHLQPSDIQ